ncbi:TonB-dependent receptor domain-containing protein [Kordiimonas sp. SCSIO 12610]|uniref:TonB-dependent receptor domain-containing protein n=1 Tax=Kordiimonas sp. SCSIO 12610 TaxID=2829597 RepID=UPI00210AF276|nr:TonB-dependent receptor [Kordiimonas sp. SCSIO 12610]UTW56312.1 TonB-dependent receptor [Kordiimonas sp. SCSIO 12610]
MSFISSGKHKRNLMRSTSLLACMLGSISTATMAQDDASSDEGVEEVVVTGTRIRNANLTQASPVAVVDSDTIDLRQVNVAEEFLREIPGFVPSISAQVNNGNGGSTFVNPRGLGANRNIVLLNGTRVVPAGLAGITNIDVIPVALIERTEVLTGGAGSTYGADAITGVINFITKQDFEGLDFRVSDQITEEGDGNTFRVDLTTGANFDDGRGNAVLSIGYTDRDAVTQGARDFGAFNINTSTGNPGGSSTTVPSVIVVPGTTGGTLQISEDGNSLVPFDRPFNFNPFNLFQLPLEQFRIYGSANYKVNDSVEVFSEALYVQSTNETRIAPSGTFRNVLTTPLSNPFLNGGIRNQICGLDTDANTAGVQPLFSQAACDAAAVATDPNDPNFQTVDLDFGRRFVEFGTRNNERTTRLFQIKAGARGDLVSNLTWQVEAAYGESTIDSQQSGNGILSRLQQSVLSTSADACLDPSNGCVPINLFGPVGSLTPDVQQFLDVGNSNGTSTALASIVGFIGGDLDFGLPSSELPISFSVGTEFRDYSASTSSDLLSQTPGEVLGNGAANPDSSGSYDVYELFAEAVVPIVEGVAGAEELTLQLGGRLSDYSSTGDEYTYKIGGTWTPVSGVQFRGNYQRVTRAPNIGELFAPQVTGLDNFGVDPCSGSAPQNNANLEAICLAQGAPATSIGAIIVDPAGQVNVTNGGNPNLEAEDADTYTIGVIWQPETVPGLSVTVDYYNISITNAITNPTASDILASCFGNGFASGNLDISGASANSAACTSIRRNPATGNLFGSTATTAGLPQVLTNQGRLETDGIDVAVNYSFDAGFGTISNSFNGNWTNSSTFNANENDPNSLNRECVGFFSINCNFSGSIQPEFTFTNRTTLTVDELDVSLLWRWIDAVEAEPLELDSFLGANGNVAPVDDFRDDFTRIGGEHYFDLTVRYNLTENLNLTAAVLNLFDNDPEVVGSNAGTTAFNTGNVFPSTYDPLGRRYSVTLQFSF